MQELNTRDGHLFSKPNKCLKCGGRLVNIGESGSNWFDTCEKCGAIFYYRSKV